MENNQKSAPACFELQNGFIKVSDIYQKAKTDIQIATIYKHLKLNGRLFIKPDFYRSYLFKRVPDFYSTLYKVKNALSNKLGGKLRLFPTTRAETMLNSETYFEIKGRLCNYKVYQNTTIYRVLIDTYSQRIANLQSPEKEAKKLQFAKVTELLRELLKEESRAIDDYLKLF
jgi:hypothetical protein